MLTRFYQGFSDESKQEISDHHESESTSEEVVEENGTLHHLRL